MAVFKRIHPELRSLYNNGIYYRSYELGTKVGPLVIKTKAGRVKVH
jgi:hypothetical protein